jgi:hypothetical protein
MPPPVVFTSLPTVARVRGVTKFTLLFVQGESARILLGGVTEFAGWWRELTGAIPKPKLSAPKLALGVAARYSASRIMSPVGISVSNTGMPGATGSAAAGQAALPWQDRQGLGPRSMRPIRKAVGA